MTDVEILTKAVNLALSKGWKPIEDMQGMEVGPSDVTFLSAKRRVYFDVNRILFNHDFAKALWGEEIDELHRITSPWTNEKVAPWHYYLQMMVIANNRLQYLNENLPNS